jgi:LemA protein
MLDGNIILYVSAICAAAYAIFVYNRLVALRQTRKTAFADIEVQLKLRHDLIPNLVETVKGYIQHEQEVMENVSQSRSSAMKSQTAGDRSIAELQLNQALLEMFSVVENYPDLKADLSFSRLQGELSALEKTVAAARRFYNNATAELNTACQQFPANIVAGLTGFKQNESFFELEEDKRTELDTPSTVQF